MIMSKRYLHFTDHKGAEGIVDSNALWRASYGPKGAVFAVIEGGSWTPSVQTSSMGRAKNRTIAVVFTSKYLVDYAMPEEVMWHMDQLPIDVVDIIDLDEAKKLLNNSIPQVGAFEFLETHLHPAFNDLGDWTRMPENFTPWLPGRDDEKYDTARKLWFKTKDVKTVEKFWFNKTKKPSLALEVEKITRLVLSELFE